AERGIGEHISPGAGDRVLGQRDFLAVERGKHELPVGRLRHASGDAGLDAPRRQTRHARRHGREATGRVFGMALPGGAAAAGKAEEQKADPVAHQSSIYPPGTTNVSSRPAIVSTPQHASLVFTANATASSASPMGARTAKFERCT